MQTEQETPSVKSQDEGKIAKKAESKSSVMEPDSGMEESTEQTVPVSMMALSTTLQ